MNRDTEFRPCVVIPVYDHGSTIRTTVAAIVRIGLPIYLVDDGSGEATRSVLERVVTDFPGVSLSRFPRNLGKGAAVVAGLRLAHAQGMTHALQIDADGQHDTDDIPSFIDESRRRPDAVICGQPVYDDSVPKARLYGRYLTHFWVWIETLSFALKDAMCGFRLYPLAATQTVIDSVRLPHRMDFDIAIIVHLAWQGAPIVNVRTRVVYPTGGLSHFDMLRDNVRISCTHAKLVCGMLLRLPRLLARSFPRRTLP